LANKNKGVTVIEIMNDLDLGWNEVGAEVQTMPSSPFVSAIAPKLHPVLLATGVITWDKSNWLQTTYESAAIP
jgi:hypothetical protein